MENAKNEVVLGAIKHFESLQKRYIKQHNGTACEHVQMALIGLRRLLEQSDVVRCAECNYSDRPTRLPNSEVIWCWEHRRNLFSTDFCSYGERAKEEQNDG